MAIFNLICSSQTAPTRHNRAAQNSDNKTRYLQNYRRKQASPGVHANRERDRIAIHVRNSMIEQPIFSGLSG